MARVGAIVMDDHAEHTERISHRTRLYYFDRELHDVANEHIVASPHEHATRDGANWAGLYRVDGEIDLIRMHCRGRLPGDVETTMGSAELGANIFQRVMTADIVRQKNLQGIGDIAETAQGIDIISADVRLIVVPGARRPVGRPQTGCTRCS